jgi:hypothetical protein
MHREAANIFSPLGRAGFAATGPETQKFLRRFFQKAATFL